MSRIYQEIDSVGLSSENFREAVRFLNKTIKNNDGGQNIEESQLEELFFFQDFFYFVMDRHPEHSSKTLKSYLGKLPMELRADELVYARLFDNYADSYVSMDVLTRAIALGLGVDINLEKKSLDNRESLLRKYFSDEIFEDIKHRVSAKKRFTEANLRDVGYTEEIIAKALSSVDLTFDNYKEALRYFDTKDLFKSESEKAVKIFPFFIPLINALKEPLGNGESITPRLKQGNLSNLTFLIFDHLLNFERLKKTPNASAKVYYIDILKATLVLFGEKNKAEDIRADSDESAFDQLFFIYKMKFGKKEFQKASSDAIKAAAMIKERAGQI